VKREIPYFTLLVCSVCQNHCEACAQMELRKLDFSYQLSMENLLKFLECTKRSNYYIGDLNISGSGEPLLWKNFNEGIIAIKKSQCVSKITITSNGESLDKVTDEAWECIDTMQISVYPFFKNEETLDKLRLRYPLKFDKMIYTYFNNFDVPQESATIPCDCICPGPILYNDKIFPYCSTEVFGVAERTGLSLEGLYVPIEDNYFKDYDSSIIGNLEHCRFCTGNNNWLCNSVKLLGKNYVKNS